MANPTGFEHPFFKAAKNGPEVIAHRGGGGEWPGETIYAFEHAVKLGVDVLEMDVHRTADDQLVLIHNDTVDNTTNGRGRVRTFELDEIQELDAAASWSPPSQFKGIHTPSIGEVGAFLKSFPEMRLNIEIKEPLLLVAEKLFAFIQANDLQERVLVASAWPRVLQKFRKANVATSASVPEIWTYQIMDMLLNGRYRPKTDAIQWHSRAAFWPIITKRFVTKAHSLNLVVHAWTVNAPEEMARMIDVGVDGIITDQPTLLLKMRGPVVPFRAKFAASFETLNLNWIKQHFVVEAADAAIFTDPSKTIVEPGGQIFFVIENDKAAGTCAVIRHTSELFELAKMAVDPQSQGRGYGDLLIRRAIGFARQADARKLMLLTNSRLAPAVHLYEKHGFQRVPITHAQHYSRVDIEMELRL